MSRICITGVAGFIGSSVAEKLVSEGHKVIGIDNFNNAYNWVIKERNIASLLKTSLFQLIEEDILNSKTWDKVDRVDHVIHLASLAGVRPSIKEPLEYMKNNVEGTIQVLEYCHSRKVKNIVVASSSSVYGSRSKTPFKERDSCDHPVSPYAASKKATEVVCSTYNHLYNMNISCLRYFTVYGPRQRPEMAIHKFVRHLYDGKPIPIYGDGNSGRDYTYIDDIVDGTLKALWKVSGFNIYNLGGSKPVKLSNLIDLLEEITGKKTIKEYLPMPSGDVPITCAHTKKSYKELGFLPEVSIKEGLSKFVEWYQDFRKWEKRIYE